MDLKPPFINTDRAEDVPISYKYHPLILENTFQTQLLVSKFFIKVIWIFSGKKFTNNLEGIQ